MELHFLGLLIAISTFLIIGLFHPIVIKVEYYWGTRPWYWFLISGIVFVIAALFVSNTFVSAVLGVCGASSLWSIGELFEQRKRVQRGWFPRNPNRPASDYEDGEKAKAKNLIMILFLVSAANFAVAQQAEYPGDYAQEPRFKALMLCPKTAEPAHMDFAAQTKEFFHKLSYGEGFLIDYVSDFGDYPYNKLKDYRVVIMVNALPETTEERSAFEEYMEKGGGWIGFHASGYNDANTSWPWFNQFLGCGTFYCNTWPPQPALVECNITDHPITKNLPVEWVAASCEWYQWNPSVVENPDVEVLCSLSQKNYPIGIKDIVHFGPFPIVWTNKNYRMVYLNMGHGDEEYLSPTQNLLFINAFRWLAL